MRPDGAGQEQVISDGLGNWYPHLSPDGRWMVFLSCEKGVKTRPQDADVMLRLLSPADGKITVLAKLLGGQGTIGASSWSPDSTSLAFVGYQSVR